MNVKLTIIFKHQILRFNIPVDNVFVVDVLQPCHQTRNEESYNNGQVGITCLLLWEPSMSTNVVSEVASIQNIHDQINVFSVLESVVHIDDKRVL